MAGGKKKLRKPKIHQEFKGAELGDTRLSRRLLEVVRELNANPPAATINATFDDWAKTKAAYRFFANEKCSAIQLIQPHIAATRERLKNHNYAFAVSDTSFINYNNHKKTVGLGSIGRYSTNNSHSQGIIIHVTYAVALSGLVLGILAFEAWVRPPEGYDKHRDEDKESDRWLRQLKLAAEVFPKGTRMIYMADRESDLYEIFEFAKERDIDVIIRSKHDRRIRGDGLHIREAQDQSAPMGNVITKVNNKQGGSREANLEIKATKVEIQRPGDTEVAAQKRKYIELTLVSAEEVDSPEGEEKLYWRLLTTLPVSSLEDCLEVIEHYKKRWAIELLFKALKSGCAIEDCRLQHREKLIRYIAVMSVIAWRIAWKVHMNRVNPKAPWFLVLTELEYKSLWIVNNKKQIKAGLLPRSPPKSEPWTVRDAVRAIAKRGGFNGRKSDGEPGMQKIWEGWVRLQDAVELAEVVL